MKRQRGRNRNTKNRNNNNNNNYNRSLDSSGPDVKVRGTASTIFEKYTTLARDAKMSGNRVKAENLLQHAEHYLRLMNMQEAAKEEARLKAEAERAARGESNDDTDDSNSRNQNRRPHNNDRNRSPNRRDQDDANGSDETSGAPSELDVVTPTADISEKPKPAKKAPKPRKPKPVIEASDDASGKVEDKPKRRRKAPARKSEEPDAAVEAAE